MNTRTKPNTLSLDEIPNKIYYSISEVSEYTGVEPHVLRYWETKFTRLNPKRVGGNQRKYTRNDLELLFEIVHLLYQEGYTLDGAERKLRTGVQAVRQEREAAKEPAPTNETAAPSENNEPAQSNGNPNSPELIQEIKSELKDLLKLLS
ncbi:MAG: MerR family transcriptional regulator [Candidatus Hinthialibacter antarcticus]|nr:MerR family transcriptional regulator [Candidatus Hinthialibacter antarcticus]